MLPADAWARRTMATSRLMQQNDLLADALQRAGEDVIRPGGLTLISAVTNIVETQRTFRAVRFLPVVAARDRRPTVNGLKLFIHEHPNSRYFRYAVMTCAEPVPAFGDLRGAVQELSRRISKWGHEIGKCYDIEVLYRGIEFTRSTARERDAAAAERGQESDLSARYGADTVLYHVHANVLYWPKRNIDKLWLDFLRYTKQFMGAYWRDNERLGNVEEIVKYCSKPADTLAASDDELVWLYRQTQRLKICQPMGEFRRWLRELKTQRKKIARVHDGRGDGKLMRVKKGRRGGNQEEAADEDGNLIEDDEANEDGDGDAAEDAHEVPKTRERTGAAVPPSNLVIGLSLPQWRHSPWAEPMIMIQNYDPAAAFGEDGGDIQAWQRQARQWWDDAFAPPPEEALRVARMALDASMSSNEICEAAEAACYIVHTCRPTVPAPGNADEEVPPEELDDDLREVVSLFDGATVVRLAPRPTDEDDEIPFEAPDVVARWAKMRADLAESEARWAEWRASAAHAAGRSPEHGCRIAA
ncbi:hypothetical protein ACO34A_21830 [Rhizobium sp. ACO-34A]|nr:hypothetical protein ACO34A_21830 [Rhizobium sp. ACO-34A]